METTELTPVTLQCVDGSEVCIVRARRVHHKDWNETNVILVTIDDEELSFCHNSNLLEFNYVRDEVAEKTFRVLDEPNAGMWLITASQLLKFVSAAAVEEVEDKEEAAEAA